MTIKSGTDERKRVDGNGNLLTVTCSADYYALPENLDRFLDGVLCGNDLIVMLIRR